MTGQEQRTEQPTAQRLKKARSEGRFAISREFVAGIQFAVFVSMVVALADSWWPAARQGVRQLMRTAFVMEVNAGSVASLLRETMAPAFLPFLAGGMLIFASALGAQLAVTGFGLAGARLSPDFNRLNPVTKLRELPAQNLRSALEVALMLPLLTAAAYFVVSGHLKEFLGLPLASLESGTTRVGSAMASLLWRAAGLLLVWGAIDLFRQKRRYIRDLRMTKQEVREEWKQNEGSPEMKMRLRRLRRELLRRRMMSEVPTATAVVVNPMHYAVALKYEMTAMAAPKVVAKGKNYLALRIKAKALDHQVPIIENKPLAQALYKHCDVGQEIPAQLYRAVAEVLAYVYRLMKGRA